MDSDASSADGSTPKTETESDDDLFPVEDAEEGTEESEKDSSDEPKVTAPKPAPRGNKRTAPRAKPGPTQGNPKSARVRSTGDDDGFDF